MAVFAWPPEHPVSVALADDHPVVRAGLRTLLEAESHVEVVGEFADVATTVRGVAALHPDVLVLDLAMSGQSSLPAIPALLAAVPGMAVVILTMQEDPGFAREALRLGARGYVLKDAAADELLLAVRTVMRGSTYLHPALGAQIATEDRSGLPLTEREGQVLQLLAEGHTNSEVASRLYLSLRTVEAHRGALRAKLGLESRAELTAYARAHGIGP